MCVRVSGGKTVQSRVSSPHLPGLSRDRFMSASTDALCLFLGFNMQPTGSRSPVMTLKIWPN